MKRKQFKRYQRLIVIHSDDYLKHGFYRIYADGKEYNLDEPINLDKKKKHNIDLVIDRLTIKEENKKRLFDSIELALKLSSGILKLKYEDREELLTENSICLDCNISYGKPEPAVFSFNSPQGACPECGGLGYKEYFDEDLIVPDKNLSLKEDAVISFSSLPILPFSPACGFKPRTAIFGLFFPRSIFNQSKEIFIIFLSRSSVIFAGTSEIGIWIVERIVISLSE